MLAVTWCRTFCLPVCYPEIERLRYILTVVLYGCETWSLTLREECGLRVFENSVSRKIFGPKRDEVTGEWRKQHNEELNDLYSLPNVLRVMKLRRMKWARHVACMGGKRGVYRVLVGRPEGRSPFAGPNIGGMISRRTLLHGVTNYQQQALTNTIQNKVISAARLEVTEGPVALLR